jgi:phospholipase C
MSLSFTGLIHMPRLKERLATHFVPYSEFEQDVANGTLPDFSLIEPNMITGHSDYHPAYGQSLSPGDMDLPFDPPSSIRGGEAFLARIYEAVRSAASSEGSNAYNTLFFIGWDEPGGTYDHVPPEPVPPPDPSAPAGQLDFKFDRSGYRVPAIIVSPWVNEGIVINDEHRHTSMIATLRKVWDLGDAFTRRDAAAAPFDHLLSHDSPRDPATWPDVEALPVSQFQIDMIQLGKALSRLGKAAGGGMLEHAAQAGVAIPPDLSDPNAHPSPEQVMAGLRKITAQFFPRLAPPA